MKQVAALGYLMIIQAAAIRSGEVTSGHARSLQTRSWQTAKAPGRAGRSKAGWMNETEALATQAVSFYHREDCKGESAKLNSSANAAIREFGPYFRNLWSVKLCGKGTFFYYATPDMQLLSLLGHVTRCGPDVTKSTDECDCENMKPEIRKLVESFTLEYC